MLRISLSMVATSCRPGTFSSVTVCAVSRAAQSSGSAAFLAPEISTVPASELPPFMRSLSIGSLLHACGAGLLRAIGRPLGGRAGFYGQGMHLIVFQPAAQRGINALVALDRAQALKRGGDDSDIPVPTVARQVDMFARQVGGNNGLKFFAGHDFAVPCLLLSF